MAADGKSEQIIFPPAARCHADSSAKRILPGHYQTGWVAGSNGASVPV
jgi:hypothetical protein